MADCTGGTIPSLQVQNTDCNCVSIQSITWNTAGNQFTITLTNSQSITSPVLEGSEGASPVVLFRVSGTILQYNIDGGAWVSIYDLSLLSAGGVLYNPQVQHSTLGTSLEILDTYTLPAGELATDGSYIDIEAEFITTTANVVGLVKYVAIMFNGNNITGSNVQLFVSSVKKLILKARINRFSNTVIKNEMDVIAGTYSGGLMYALPSGVLNYFGGSMAALNLTTTPYDITAQADGVAIGDITLQSFTVTIFKK